MRYLLAALAAIGLAGTASADFYGDASAGTCIVDRNNFEYKNCQQIGITAGYELSGVWSAELRANRLDADIIGFNGGTHTTGTYEREELTIGIVHKPRTFGKLEPFIGAHIGVGELTHEFLSFVATDTSIALLADHDEVEYLWSVRGGADYDIAPQLSLFGEIGYTQYLDNPVDVRFETATGQTGLLQPNGVLGEDRSYDVRVGIRFKL